MRRVCRLSLVAACMAGVVPATGSAQVELDRIVTRAGGRVITQSDLHQARLLKLVEDTSSDAAVQRCLEDRWLTLEEIGRGTPVATTSESELAARRASWDQSHGGASAVPALLKKGAMSEAALQVWLRDDLKIQAYLRRRFSGVPEPERGKATNEWLNRLRQRAKLQRDLN